MPYVPTRKRSRVQSPLAKQILDQVQLRSYGMGQTDNSASSFDTSVSNLPLGFTDNSAGSPLDISGTNIPLLGNLGTPVSTTTPSSGGFNLSNLISSLTQAASAGQQIYLRGQNPALVPGTQAIYDPASGQYYNPSTGQVVNQPGAPGGSTTFGGLSPFQLDPQLIVFGGLILGAVVVLGMFRR